MNTPTTSSNPVLLARTLLKELQQTFEVFRDYTPLSIGIDKQIVAQLPEINRKILRIALGMHTRSLRYLRSMKTATTRHDLHGNVAEEITELHRAHASKILQERIKQDTERRQAQHAAKRKAELDAKEAEEMHLRTEKLNRLAAKFSSH